MENINMLLAGMAKHPIITKHCIDIKKQVFERICDLSVTAVVSNEPIKKSELNSYREVEVKKGFEWAEEKFGACWFHLKGEVPTKYLDRQNDAVVLMNIRGEGVAYLGEETVDIITPILSLVDVLQAPTAGKRTLDIVRDGKVDSWVDCGYNGHTGKFLTRAEFQYACIALKNKEIYDFYYDYLTVALVLATAEKNEKINAIKEEIIAILTESYKYFSQKNLLKAKETLQKYLSKTQEENGVMYTMVGQGHLDLAWLWPERESKRKAVRTFTNAVSMIEKNPSYVFGASQAQMFFWAKESNPELFCKLQKYVESGNIELQGGMWVECDCNMPGGESLIRQFLYGDRFFLQYFGKTSKTVWLPDAFGYPATLPQIIKGVGKEYFATIKITWNQINKFPYQSFYWVAPDGEKVLCHISPEGSYYNDGTPLAIDISERKNIQKETKTALIIYGVGDGGGGPGEGHVEIAKRCNNLYGMARTKMGSAESFFDGLSKVQHLPEYNGELYLEKHQGTLTSQSDNKKLNRMAERNLHTTEWLSAYCNERPDLEYEWKKLLMTQFHDVLPGSAIERVHKESQEDLQNIISDTDKKIKTMLAKIQKGKGMSAINPSPFSRDEYFNVFGQGYRFIGKGYSATSIKKEVPSLKIYDDSIENDFVSIRLKRGVITSFIDKQNNFEISTNKGLNVLKIYKDKKTKYNAWDIDMDYIKHPEELTFVSQKTYIEGAYAVAETVHTYGKSKITQKIIISNSTLVKVQNEISWHESHKMLRAEFYPAIYGKNAECDIQFGQIERSTSNESDIDRAKFEICAHKYISVGDGKNNFALYSDSKYGYSAKNGMISIALLRSPKYPDKNCDMGNHTFCYAMDFAYDKKEIVARGYNFSYPLIPCEGELQIEPIAEVVEDNIIIETIKCGEEEGIVVRLYERFGKETVTGLIINRDYKEIYFCDLLENNRVKGSTKLHFRPHEIKTLIII